MVMDATQPQQPSPQSVGREFVRQYYTLLNKAPNHLHRFYNNNSSFIHGESTLVVGQKNIHNRIQQLNFHDCHAKISQVDAQATLGNGVVVQVTGELSNDGQPMRRFTQTFVLAAQSPKKYYVHNDIFRYQDMYSDEENEGEVRSENGDELEQPSSISGNGGGDHLSQASAAIADAAAQLPTQLVSAGPVMQAPQGQQQPNAPQQHAIYYPLPATGGRPVPVLPGPQGAAVPLAAQFPNSPAGTIASVPASGVSPINGVVAHEDLLSGMHQQQPAVAATASSAVVVGGSPAVQGAASVPVANVLNAPATAGNNTAALPQNAAAGGVLNYQQSQLMQQPLVQPSQQQQLLTSPQSASASQGTAATLNDFDEGNNSLANNESATIQSSPEAPVLIEPVVPTAPVVDDFKTINEQQLQEKYEAAKLQQNEPKTYANLFKSSTSPSSFVTAAMQQQQQVQQQQQQQQQTSNNSYQSTTSIPSATFTQSNAAAMAGFNRNASSTIDNNSNPLNQGGPLPQRNSSARVNKDYEQRRTSNAQQFGDNQQLFLGNIPHHASEEDLKTLFARFGTIIELRILSKPGGKMAPGVRNPLNYGFITYEEAESVQTCLAACPLYFPEGAHDAQKLNVEEKKPRMRDLPPRQSMNMNAGSGMGGGQRNMSGGPQSRSLSNTGGGAGGNSGMMRGSSASNSMSRGSSSGQRMGGGFNRNDNRSGSQSNGGGQIRGGNNNSQSGGNSSYAGRR